MKLKTHMLATDLDNTLAGNDSDVRDLITFFQNAPYDVALVYVTGRHGESVRQLISEANLPIPDLVISDVGTKIWHMPDWQEDLLWSKQMRKGWQPERVLETASRFPSLHRQKLPEDCRISFTLEDGIDTVNAFKDALCAKHIPHHLVFSSNNDVDVLPRDSGKGKALEYVIQQFAHPSVNLLVAGDSGNDTDMLSRGWPSVIVGNAHEELKGIPDHPNLYRASRHYAGGIYEAWQHFYGASN